MHSWNSTPWRRLVSGSAIPSLRRTPDCNPTLSEEPYAGNPHVRFCGGADPVTGRPTRSLLKITDVTFLSRERAKSTFMADFRQLLEEAVPEGRRDFDWNDPQHDPQRKYMVDCRINGMARPLFVYGLLNDDRTRDSMISMLQFERWGVSYRSLAIFEDQEAINRKVLARFSDVCEKQFSSIETNRERIAKYVQETLLSSH